MRKTTTSKTKKRLKMAKSDNIADRRVPYRVLQTVLRAECCGQKSCRHCCRQKSLKQCCIQSVADGVLRTECCRQGCVQRKGRRPNGVTVLRTVLWTVLRTECCRQCCGYSVTDRLLQTVLRTECCRQCCVQRKGRRPNGVSFSVPSPRSKAVTHFRAPV